jgi:hypothetical protein
MFGKKKLSLEEIKAAIGELGDKEKADITAFLNDAKPVETSEPPKAETPLHGEAPATADKAPALEEKELEAAPPANAESPVPSAENEEAQETDIAAHKAAETSVQEAAEHGVTPSTEASAEPIPEEITERSPFVDKLEKRVDMLEETIGQLTQKLDTIIGKLDGGQDFGVAPAQPPTTNAEGNDYETIRKYNPRYRR